MNATPHVVAEKVALGAVRIISTLGGLMFAYIDESGHTGKNSSDLSQPVFNYMAMVVNQDIDKVTSSTFNEIKKKHNISEIHGVELGDKIEDVSSDILGLLKLFSPKFGVAIVEKEFLVYAKLYDIIFDNVENKGARRHTYQIRMFRLLLLRKLISHVPSNIAHNFYINCLFASNENSAIAVLIETCENILTIAESIEDVRAKELIIDAFTWAKNNPKQLTTFQRTKDERWHHLPNIAGFLPIMDLISKSCRRRHGVKIIHDEQQQIINVIKRLHSMAADVKTPSIIDMKENGSFKLNNIKESDLIITNSKTSFGLQIVDLCLYILTHSELIVVNESKWPKANRLLKFVKANCTLFEITMKTFNEEVMGILNKLENYKYTNEDLDRGREFIQHMENEFKKTT